MVSNTIASLPSSAKSRSSFSVGATTESLKHSAMADGLSSTTHAAARVSRLEGTFLRLRVGQITKVMYSERETSLSDASSLFVLVSAKTSSLHPTL